MELQNIVIDFNNNSVSTMFNDKHYSIDNVLTQIGTVETAFKEAYNVDFDFVVVQLTEDQHESEARIRCQKNEDVSLIPLIDIATNHSELYLELKSIRVSIETELQNILNS